MAVLRALLGVLAVLACVQVIVSANNDGPEGNHGGQSLDQLIQWVFKLHQFFVSLFSYSHKLHFLDY